MNTVHSIIHYTVHKYGTNSAPQIKVYSRTTHLAIITKVFPCILHKTYTLQSQDTYKWYFRKVCCPKSQHNGCDRDKNERNVFRAESWANRRTLRRFGNQWCGRCVCCGLHLWIGCLPLSEAHLSSILINKVFVGSLLYSSVP